MTTEQATNTETTQQETAAVETTPAAPPAAAPTTDTILAKVSKGETLTETEQEIFKSIPTDLLPKPQIKDPTVVEEPAAAAPAKPKEEAKPGEVSAERRALLEKEVEKPRPQQDLTKFTPAELSLFWELKKSRRRNQSLEEELEISRVENIVTNLRNKEKEEATAAEEVVDPLKLLEGRPDDDLLTAGELRKILQASKPKPAPKPQPQTPLRTTDQIRLERVEAAQTLSSKGVKDFEDVIDFAKVALEGDTEAVQVLREVAREGGNTVEQTYWLIKGSKAWPTIEKMIRESKGEPAAPAKPAGNPETNGRAERLEQNATKVRTTGPAAGAPANSKEFTVAEIQGMTSADIRKLPKATRQAILDKYGSNPNYNV